MFYSIQTYVVYLIIRGRVTPIVVNGITTANDRRADSSCMEDALAMTIGFKRGPIVN